MPVTNDPIRDASGRVIAPPQTVLAVRPMGPWQRNHAPMRVICAWCPTWNPHDPANAHASHGLCRDCEARLQAEMDAEAAA